MARKRNPAPEPILSEPILSEPILSEPILSEPSMEAATSEPEPTAPRVADMPVRDLLQMLGRTLPENTSLQPPPAMALPKGIDAEARITDLTAGDLLRLLAAL